MATRTVTVELKITDLVATKQLLATLKDLHRPVEEDAERYHRDGDLEGTCPTPDARYPSDPCPGHDMKVKVCQECGYEHDGDAAIFRSWPCPTEQALSQYAAGDTPERPIG